MAQTDYVVKLRGEDELSRVIQGVKTNLRDTGQAASRLDDIQKKFKQIAESTATPKKQLRDIQKLLGEMNLEGLNKTELFTEMAERAGALKDAISDAGQAVKAYANDTLQLEAAAQAFSLVTTGATIARSAMNMFGVENESVERSIKQLQMALVLLNGVQQVANLLNKDSALMLKLKQIQLKANAAATTGDTAATGANTVVTGANTVAVTLAQKARERLNQAVAIGKALMGDWTGLLLVGASALTTYTLFSDKSTDSIEKQSEALDSARKNIEEYNKSVSSQIGSIIGKFMQLKAEYLNLKSVTEKTQFIKDNELAFKQLGLAIDDVTSAEIAFVNQADKVCEALAQIARAQGINNAITKDWENFYSDTNRAQKRIKSLVTNRNQLKDEKDRKAGDDYLKLYLTDKQLKEYLKTGKVPLGMEGGYTAAINADRERDRQEQIARLNQRTDALTKESMQHSQQGNQTLKNLDLANNKGKSSSGRGKSRHNSRSKPTPKPNPAPPPPDEEEFIDENSIKYAEKQISELKEKWKRAGTDEQRAVIKESIDKWQERLDELEGKEVKVEFKAEEGSLTDLKDKLSEIEHTMSDFNLGDDMLKSLADESVEIQKQIDLLEERNKVARMSATDYKRQVYEDSSSKVEQLREDVHLNIIGAEEAMTQIDEINKKLEELGLKTIDIHIGENGELETFTEALERQQEQMQANYSAISDMGGAMAQLGGAIDSTAGQWVAFTGKTAQSIAQLLPQILTLITAKNAEALASATAAGAQAGFPAMFGAIAAGVATVAAIFASLPKFETGGIIPGGSFSGDNLLVRANAGEMILNRRQQTNLFNAISSGNLGGPSVIVGDVRLRMSGTDIIGVINNTNSKIRKQS